MDGGLRNVGPAAGEMGGLQAGRNDCRRGLQTRDLTQFSRAQGNRCCLSGPLGNSLSHSKTRPVEANCEGHAPQDGRVQSRTLIDDPDRGNLRSLNEAVDPLLGTALALAHHQNIVRFVDDDNPVPVMAAHGAQDHEMIEALGAIRLVAEVVAQAGKDRAASGLAGERAGKLGLSRAGLAEQQNADGFLAHKDLECDAPQRIEVLEIIPKQSPLLRFRHEPAQHVLPGFRMNPNEAPEQRAQAVFPIAVIMKETGCEKRGAGHQFLLDGIVGKAR